jgi:CelD/BcsL family acetyltransferase involved in cellulose biosynthesis
MLTAGPASRTLLPPSRETVPQGPPEPEYTVGVVDSLTRWAELEKDWNDLLTQSRANVVFLTWEWLYTWAECFWRSDRELFILAIFRGRELVGIAPWCIKRRSSGLVTVRQIEFLGASDVASDYLDVFAKRGKEKEVAGRIYDFLFHEARSRWDILVLLDVPANSLLLLHLLDKIADDGKHVEIQAGVFCPTVQLPATQTGFMASLSPHRRAQFQRHRRLLQLAGKVEHSTTTTRDGLDIDALDALYSLYHMKSGAEKAGFYHFLQRFLTRASGTDWVQVDLLAVDGKPVAGLFHLRYGVTLFQYLLAADKTVYPKTSVGTVLIGLCLLKAIAANVGEYDSLRGSEDYKFHWATGGRRSLTVRLYQRRLPVLLLVGLRSLKALLKVLLR